MSRSVILKIFLVLAITSLGGCHHPGRQSVPQVNHIEREAEWRGELTPGRRADWALAYLLDAGFDVRLTRDEQKRTERIVATLPDVVRDAAGEKKNWQIDLAIADDVIQRATITPLAPK
jgi:hypothetical protein